MRESRIDVNSGASELNVRDRRLLFQDIEGEMAAVRILCRFVFTANTHDMGSISV